MPEKIFVIGIGGTGMRCLESFVHTCAVGMFDSTEVEMLALDTDQGNGNFDRLRSLVNCYRSVNGGTKKSSTFFSAKINYHEFTPGYTDSDTFGTISKYAAASAHRADSPVADLIDLFVDADVRDMPLKEGYRAQTQMGSMLMYYAIVKAAYESTQQKANGISEIINALSQSVHAPVFIFGSVFGGTGASSIPIIPLALRAAASVMGVPEISVSDHPYGTIVLTNYFQFDNPDSNGQVVAKSNNFAVNSQAALMFYNNDVTVNSTYNRMYLLGRASQRSYNNGEDQNSKLKSSVGGSTQKNPADFMELIAASAAYNFFKETAKDNAFSEDNGNRAFFISHDDADSKLDFPLFWQEDSDIFKKKLGAAVAAAVLETSYAFYDNVAQTPNMFSQVNVDSEQFKNLVKYWTMLVYQIDSNECLVDGWLPQMYKGRGGDGIMFKDTLFSCRTKKDLSGFKFNKDLYAGDNPPQFNVGLIESRFDVVKKAFNKIGGGTDSFDDMISRSYATLTGLYYK